MFSASAHPSRLPGMSAVRKWILTGLWGFGQAGRVSYSSPSDAVDPVVVLLDGLIADVHLDIESACALDTAQS